MTHYIGNRCTCGHWAKGEARFSFFFPVIDFLLFFSFPDLNNEAVLEVAADKKVYMVALEGSVMVGSEHLLTGDAATASGPLTLTFKPNPSVHLLVIQVAQIKK